jgi:hypothetical protein
MDVLKWILKFLPEDPNPNAGFWIFRLPESAMWMNRVLVYHDEWYRTGPKIGMRLSDIDWRIFKALTIYIETVEDPMERCQMVQDVCRYWPIMRRVGRKLYGRHRTQAEKELPPL